MKKLLSTFTLFLACACSLFGAGTLGNMALQNKNAVDITGGTIVGTAVTLAAGSVTDAMSALSVKPAVAVVATANLTLSGEQTIDGVTTSASLVLATGQSTGSQNGPWVSAAGAWARPTWYANGSTTQAPQFLTTFVRLGTTYQGSTWRMTTASVTIGTTATTWVQTPTNINSVTGSLPDANNTVSNSTTTSLTALTTIGATGTVTNFPGTTVASSSITGTVKIGNGTAATNVGIGGGIIYAGGTVQASNFVAGGPVIASGYIQGSYLQSQTGFCYLGSLLDSTISRSSAGVLQIGNGSGGAVGSLLLTNLTASGTLTVGSSGTAVSRILSATATLNFDLTALTVQDLTIAVTNAAVGDVVTLGVPNGSVTTSASFSGWVSSAGTVTVRCKTQTVGEDPASGTFRATVIQH